MNKCTACQYKWQREWATRQSPPLTIKREKQSKEAININKVLTTIDYLAPHWWAMIVMDLNSYTQLINIFTHVLNQPNRQKFLHYFLIFGGVGLYKMNAHHPEAQWQCCVWCDMPAGCNGNCSSAQHPAVSSLTVRRTVTSISCIWVWASQQVFLYCTRSPC